MKLPLERKRLYCAWIRQDERPGAPLVAVWMDPVMSAFAEHPIAAPGVEPEELHVCEEG